MHCRSLSASDTEAITDAINGDSILPIHNLSLDAGLPGSHPSPRRVFEYWDLFVQRFDPLMKILHCPSFTKHLFTAMDAPKRLDKHVETLLFSIYFSAVSTCTAKECTETFGESRVALMRLYGKTIEAKLSDNYSLPSLESVQALVMYLVRLTLTCVYLRAAEPDTRPPFEETITASVSELYFRWPSEWHR